MEQNKKNKTMSKWGNVQRKNTFFHGQVMHKKLG